MENDSRFKEVKLINNTQNAKNWIVGFNVSGFYNYSIFNSKRGK
jgi:hypothetical protein